jgi:glutaredoxin 3
MMLAIVYSTRLCPYCFLAKRLLDRRGISYEERRMKRSERDRLVDLGGGLTYPQILIGERIVNGWTELRELDRSGDLERLDTDAPVR